VGFTAGSGGQTATQEIISWSYSASGSSATAPTITTQPGNETVTVGQTATFSVVAAGSTPLSYQWQKNETNISGATSASYTTPATASTDNGSTFDVIVTNSAGSVTSNTATLTVGSGSGTTPVNFASGFTSTSGLQLNGSASWNQSAARLRLTDGGANEAGSAFWTTPVNIQSFTNSFSFQLTNANADGFTFTIQNAGVTALGPGGGGLGYSYAGLTPAGITPSIAVKFDLYSNAGESNDSTGEYADGATPTVPSIDMTSSGVNLHSGDIMNGEYSRHARGQHGLRGLHRWQRRSNGYPGNHFVELQCERFVGDGADDHDAAGERDSDGGSDGDVLGGGGGQHASQLPVAEERDQHLGGNVGELHDAGDGEHGQRFDVRRHGHKFGGLGHQQHRDSDGRVWFGHDAG
jgi:hypothetical protein